MKICVICKREAFGFKYLSPPLRISDSRNYKNIKHFCSKNCQKIFSNFQIKNNMIDLTKMEKEAIESTLKPLGEYVAEVGMDKPLSQYKREEILCLVEVALNAYFDFMQGSVDDSEVLPC